MTKILLGDNERKEIREAIYPFSEASPVSELEDIIDKIQEATRVRMLKKFSVWLIQRANNQTARNMRQTKAYALWLEFTKDNPLALPDLPDGLEK